MARILDKLSIGIIYTIKKHSTKEAVINYLCRETWSAYEIYTDDVLAQCLRNVWCDLLDNVEYPSSLMREYYHVRSYPWNMDEIHALISVLSGVKVREKDENGEYRYINGFTPLEGFND